MKDKFSFEDLDVWKKSVGFCARIAILVDNLGSK